LQVAERLVGEDDTPSRTCRRAGCARPHGSGAPDPAASSAKRSKGPPGRRRCRRCSWPLHPPRAIRAAFRPPAKLHRPKHFIPKLSATPEDPQGSADAA
jgi:hypothetical protein